MCGYVTAGPCARFAAFEATRFYNVSESSPLARELCDGPTCNEVESSTNQWTGECRQSPGSWTCRQCVTLLRRHVCLQALPRRTSATACSAAWRSSSLSAAPATGTAAMTATRCAGRTASATRTCARWRCSPVATGRASSRSRCPSARRVRPLRPAEAASDPELVHVVDVWAGTFIFLQ